MLARNTKDVVLTTVVSKTSSCHVTASQSVQAPIALYPALFAWGLNEVHLRPPLTFGLCASRLLAVYATPIEIRADEWISKEVAQSQVQTRPRSVADG